MSPFPLPDAVPAAVEAVIAIPVRNEAERIAACLRAIDAQAGLTPGSLGVVLFLNNCTDGTSEIVADLKARMSVPVRVKEVEFAGANAGWARREAMEEAAAWIESGSRSGIILSTDADSRVPPDWVARNKAAISAGADAVAGRVELDEAEAALLPPSLPARGRLEDAYSALLTEAESMLDPDPNDPWPCHRTTIGATLAVTLKAYRQVGGMPPMALGEDGAFVAALLQQGLRVRHAVDVVVTISARLTGRAPGGVADTIRSRCELPDALCDARMERFPRALYRYAWRGYLRRLHGQDRLGSSPGWARLLAIPPEEARRIAAIPLAGLAIAQAERESPHLVYKPIGPKALPGQIQVGSAVLSVMRKGNAIREGLRGGSRWNGSPSTRERAPTGPRCAQVLAGGSAQPDHDDR